MGHVPPRPLPANREGADLPRRQRRRAGTARALDLKDRRHLGELGEAIARWYLEDHGLQVVASNVEIDGGEVDVLAIDRGTRVAVEVRTITGSGDPADAIGPAKRRRVHRLAARIGAGRVDYIGIRIRPDAALIHWVPGGF